MSDDGSPKIYLLPNLMTAGNLFCGFAATLKILEGAMLLAADPLARFIGNNPTIVMLALGFLLMIVATLLADGVGGCRKSELTLGCLIDDDG